MHQHSVARKPRWENRVFHINKSYSAFNRVTTRVSIRETFKPELFPRVFSLTDFTECRRNLAGKSWTLLQGTFECKGFAPSSSQLRDCRRSSKQFRAARERRGGGSRFSSVGDSRFPCVSAGSRTRVQHTMDPASFKFTWTMRHTLIRSRRRRIDVG